MIPSLTLVVLNMAKATPVVSEREHTGRIVGAEPSFGLMTNSTSLGTFRTMSWAWYWSPKACLPIMMGLFHPGTIRGIRSRTIGSLKTVPLRIERMVPLGLFHIFFKLNSWTRASSGVMVAHLIPTLYFKIASAESIVTWSLVASRLGSPRSK